MKSAALSEIKKELQHLSSKDLTDLCIALARYKKDNKELLDYLLFESHDKENFVKEVKEEMDHSFEEIKKFSNLYYVKKGLRKVLRQIAKYSKYAGDKAISADLLIYFCWSLKQSGISFQKSQLILNMYEQQLKKINSHIKSLHEDLQSDFNREVERIQL